MLSEIRDTLAPALRLVSRSYLPADMQERYAAILRERTETLELAAKSKVSAAQ